MGKASPLHVQEVLGGWRGSTGQRGLGRGPRLGLSSPKLAASWGIVLLLNGAVRGLVLSHTRPFPEAEVVLCRLISLDCTIMWFFPLPRVVCIKMGLLGV